MFKKIIPSYQVLLQRHKRLEVQTTRPPTLCFIVNWNQNRKVSLAFEFHLFSSQKKRLEPLDPSLPHWYAVQQHCCEALSTALICCTMKCSAEPYGGLKKCAVQCSVVLWSVFPGECMHNYFTLWVVKLLCTGFCNGTEATLMCNKSCLV